MVRPSNSSESGRASANEICQLYGEIVPSVVIVGCILIKWNVTPPQDDHDANGWMGGLMRGKKRETYRFATCVLHYSRARRDIEAEHIKRKNVSLFMSAGCSQTNKYAFGKTRVSWDFIVQGFCEQSSKQLSRTQGAPTLFPHRLSILIYPSTVSFA